MDDRERIIEYLSHCLLEYGAWLNSIPIATWVLKDALELLKEQEAVEPEKMLIPVKPTFRCGRPCCGNCGLEFHRALERNNFCPNCGKTVDWLNEPISVHGAKI